MVVMTFQQNPEKKFQLSKKFKFKTNFQIGKNHIVTPTKTVQNMNTIRFNKIIKEMQ